MVSKATEELIAKFVMEEKREIAIRMLKRKISTKEEIAEYLDLPIAVIDEIKDNLEEQC